MTEIAKFAWTVVLITFFVGMKIFIILCIAFLAMVILHRIKPKWFEPK